MLIARANTMLTKRIGAFPACLRLGTELLLLLILGQVVHGQQLSSPCPSIFSYRRDSGNDQVFGYIEVPNLRIGQAVKLNVDLSIGLAVPQNNIGSITLVKSKEQTFRDIYNNQPAQYRVNFPFRNVLPNLLEIRVDGQPICYGQKATGQVVTTINLDHTLVTQLQTLSNVNGNNVYAIPNQPVQQSPSPIFYTPTVQIRPQPVDQSQFIIEPEVFENRGPQPQSNDVCGEPTNIYSRLSINGQLSARGQFPWAVPIFNKRPIKPR
uniref:Serine protease gd N-terminal domain-containing protein n=1 Tax=Anopheles atroparvus TaxID=41427 RepID=A0AAG5CZY3_ANOAO